VKVGEKVGGGRSEGRSEGESEGEGESGSKRGSERVFLPSVRTPRNSVALVYVYGVVALVYGCTSTRTYAEPSARLTAMAGRPPVLFEDDVPLVVTLAMGSVKVVLAGTAALFASVDRVR
jgi:hypothetical protein